MDFFRKIHYPDAQQGSMGFFNVHPLYDFNSCGFRHMDYQKYFQSKSGIVVKSIDKYKWGITVILYKYLQKSTQNLLSTIIVTSYFLLFKGTLRYEPEAKLMLFLLYELAEQLAELHPRYTSWYPRKKNKIWWYLACYSALEGALCCISIIALHFGLTWQTLTIQSALIKNITQQSLPRNSRLLEGPSHHLLNSRQCFQAVCLQTKFRLSASK